MTSVHIFDAPKRPLFTCPMRRNVLSLHMRDAKASQVEVNQAGARKSKNIPIKLVQAMLKRRRSRSKNIPIKLVHVKSAPANKLPAHSRRVSPLASAFCSTMHAEDFGFRVSGLGFRVWGLRFEFDRRREGLGFGVWGGLWVWGVGCGVWS